MENNNNTVQLNDKKRCAHCFTSIEGEEACKMCVPSDISGGLPSGTVLNGQFVVGDPCFYDGHCYTYYGYDLAKDKRVLVREFFPKGNFVKRVDKKLVFDAQYPNQIEDMEIALKRFHNNARYMSGMKNVQGVLPVTELFDENNTSYSVTEIVDSSILLSDFISLNGGRILKRAIFNIIEKLMAVLDPIHKSGVAHGDLAPHNILITQNKVMLLGFVLNGYRDLSVQTKICSDEDTSFAPFELSSKTEVATPTSDVYSVGGILYYMLTGKYPANAYSRIELGDGEKVAPAIEPNCGLPDSLVSILEKALEIKPINRYKDLSELCRALNAAKFVSLKLKSQKQTSQAMPKAQPTKSDHTKSKAQYDTKKGKKPLSGKKSNIYVILGIVAEVIAIILLIVVLINNNTPDSEQGSSAGKGTTSVQSSASSNKDNVLVPSESNGSAQDNSSDTLSDELNTSNDYDWVDNVIRDDFNPEDSSCLGNSEYDKTKIHYIVVRDSVETASKKAWDISKSKDKSVLAWVKTNEDGISTLYIAGNGGVSAGTSCAELFSGYTRLIEVTFNGKFHTDQVQNMSGMFKNCKRLKEVDIDTLVVLNATNLSSMFEGCKALKKLDLSFFNTTQVTDFSRMFYNCSAIRTLDLSSFETLRAENMSEMFCGCSSLRKLKIPNFNVSEKTELTGMFDNCDNLDEIDTQNPDILRLLQEKS